MKETDNIFEESVAEHIRLSNGMYKHKESLDMLADKCIKSLSAGGKIIFAGNGGSAADAIHLSAELVGRFIKDRKSLASISLNSNPSTITAIANDFGYDYIFSRQLEGLVYEKDVFIGISTSGNSENLIQACKKAQELGIYCFGLLGRDGGIMKTITDDSIIIDHQETARIQEMHILLGHILCEKIERNY